MHKLTKEIMSKTICYTPLKGVDDVIATQVPSWNSHYVANLRGMYEGAKGKSTTDVNKLLAFRRSLNAKDAKALTKAITNPIAAYDQLKEAFSTQERVDRVNMIANTFSDVVDAIQESNPSLSREDIIMGYKDQNGKFQGGPAFIYSEVYKTLKAEMDEYAENGYEEEVEKYRQVFKNSNLANQVLRQISKKPMNLIQGAMVVPERQIWQLLAPSDGVPKVTVKIKDKTYTIDYTTAMKKTEKIYPWKNI